MNRSFLLLIALLSFASCSNKKIASEKNNNKCSTIGTVQDFTGLDGCRLLIVLENGDKLLPAEVRVPNFELKAGQKIQFGYEEIKDAISICMAEKMSIIITCAELLESPQGNSKCVETEDANQVEWMREAISKHQPYTILRFNYLEGFAYWFQSKLEKHYLYDCEGTFLCEAKNDITECDYPVDTQNRGVIIWERPN